MARLTYKHSSRIPCDFVTTHLHDNQGPAVTNGPITAGCGDSVFAAYTLLANILRNSFADDATVQIEDGPSGSKVLRFWLHSDDEETVTQALHRDGHLKICCFVSTANDDDLNFIVDYDAL